MLSVFSGPAGKTALIAASAVGGVLTFLGLSVWHVVAGKAPFDAMSFASAWALVLGASAAAIAGHAWGQAKAQAISAPASQGTN